MAMCECANLDWTHADMKLDHHPDCKAAGAPFGAYIPEDGAQSKCATGALLNDYTLSLTEIRSTTGTGQVIGVGGSGGSITFGSGNNQQLYPSLPSLCKPEPDLDTEARGVALRFLIDIINDKDLYAADFRANAARLILENTD